MIAVPMSPPSMISPSSMKAPGTSGTSRCFHWVSSRLVLLAGEQVGAPQDQRQLAELAGLELEGAAEEIQFVLPLTVRPIPGTCTRHHQEDRAEQQRVGQRPVQPDGHPGGDQQQNGADGHRDELFAEEVRGRQGQLQRLDHRGGVHHHQAERGDQQPAAEDQQ